MRESPVNRIKRLGVRSADAIDLLAVVRASTLEEVDQNLEPARRWLVERQRLTSLVDLSPADLRSLGDFDDFQILKAQALLELGRRAAGVADFQFLNYRGPEDVFKHLAPLMDRRQEQFWAVYLSAKMDVLATREVHRGTATSSIVGTREVFGEALRLGAVSLIVAHNHPSGDPTPSPEDIAVTRKLIEAGKLLDIELLDHVIVGHTRYQSLRDLGVLG